MNAPATGALLLYLVVFPLYALDSLGSHYAAGVEEDETLQLLQRRARP